MRRDEGGAVCSSVWFDRLVSDGSQKETKRQRIEELLLYCRYSGRSVVIVGSVS